jgi:iron complex transport system substrate-binding protein
MLVFVKRILSRLIWIFIPGLLAAFYPAGQSSPLELKDAAGRVVRFDKWPRKILIIGHGPQIIAHLMFMFPESRDRLIGWERRGATGSDFIPFIDPDYAKRVFPGPNPGVEQVAALRPDAVLMRGISLEAKGEALLKVGIPVVYLGLESPEQYRQDIDRIGRLLGNPGRAEAVNRFYQSRLDRIDRGLTGLAETDKPSVLLGMTLKRGGKIAVEVPAQAWMQTLQVLRAGGHPVWLDTAALSTGWTVVNLEQIARWNAEKIILVVWYTMDPRSTIEEIRADPIWRAMRAVRNGEIRAFPSDLYGWDSPDPRWILGLSWLARTLHPGRFPTIDMKTEIEAFFGELYGMTKADVASKILPTIKADYR